MLERLWARYPLLAFVVVFFPACRESDRADKSIDDARSRVEDAPRSLAAGLHSGEARDLLWRRDVVDCLSQLRSLGQIEFEKRLRDSALSELLAEIPPGDIECLLEEAGFVGDPESEGWVAYQSLLIEFAVGKANKDPEGLANALVSGALSGRIVLLIGPIAKYEPELAAEVVVESDVNPIEKKMCYGIVFSEASKHDPERAIRLVESMRFESRELQSDAVATVIANANRGEVTPERAAGILSCFTDDTLNSFPEAVARAAGTIVEEPVGNVLSVFPLDGKPWERALAVAFLEEKAYQGMKGDVEIPEFLDSRAGNLLTETERERLQTILGR